jgi:hypothetical protein
MTEPVTLELRDPQAILQGDGRNHDGLTRGQLFRRAALTGSAVIGGGLVLSGVPEAYAQDVSDVDILNFLLVNESMEVAFYTEALQRANLRGRARAFARQVRENEIIHRDTVRAALGANARPVPAFEFGNATANQRNFLRTALALENNDVAANNGAGPLLDDKRLLIAAGAIVSVEARQAAWIRRIVFGARPGRRRNLPAPSAFDPGIPPAQAIAALRATGFIRGEF